MYDNSFDISFLATQIIWEWLSHHHPGEKVTQRSFTETFLLILGKERPSGYRILYKVKFIQSGGEVMKMVKNQLN